MHVCVYVCGCVYMCVGMLHLCAFVFVYVLCVFVCMCVYECVCMCKGYMHVSFKTALNAYVTTIK